MLTRFSIEAAH